MFALISKIFFIGAIGKVVSGWIHKMGFNAGYRKGRSDERRMSCDAHYEPYHEAQD